LFAVHHLAHQRGFGHEFAIHRGFSFELAEITPPVKNRHLDAELVAGHYRPPEPCIINRHEVEKLVLAVWYLEEQQQASGLCHGLYDQHTRHDRPAGKVTGEEIFIDCDVLHTHNALQPLHFQYCVHHQERVAVRENLLDPVGIEDHR
jgi:hypothetical protein